MAEHANKHTHRLDLDELEQIARRPQPYKAQWTKDFDAMKRALPALIAELRDARKVVEAVEALSGEELWRDLQSGDGIAEQLCNFCWEIRRSDDDDAVGHRVDCAWLLARTLTGKAGG